MPWPGIKAAAVRALIYLLGAAAFAGPPLVQAEGNVGCLFSERLCLDDEWCYDDYAFGRCVSTASTLDEDDLYRYDLEKDELHEISRELSRLFALGYRWSHGYTQCRLQAMLYATKTGLSFEEDACSHLSDQDLEAALRVMEGQVPLDPQEVAVVRFTPSVDDPQGRYADEVYYPSPPDPDQQLLRERILGSNGEDILDMEDPYAAYQLRKRAWIPLMRRRSAPIEYFDNQFTSPSIYVPDDSTQLEFLPKMLSYNSVTARDTQERTDEYDDSNGVKKMYQIIRLLNRLNLSPEDLKTVLSPVSYSKLVRILQEFERRQKEAIEKEEMERLLLGDNRNGNDVEYNGRNDYDGLSSDFKRLFDRGELSGDEMPESRIYYDENDNVDEVQEYGSGFRSPPTEIFRELANSESYGNNAIGSRGVGLGDDAEVFRELQQQEMEERERFARYNDNKIKHKYNRHPNIYTEGGVVYDTSDQSEDEDNEGHSADQLEELGNFLDKYNWGFKRPERLDVKKPGPPFDQQINEAIKAGKIRDVNDETPYPTMMKKIGGVHPNLQHGSDSEYSYVYVNFKQNLRSWTHTQSIMSNISALLHIEPNAFVQGRTDRNAVTFKVLPNSRGLNATEVARRIEASKDQLGAETGMEVESAGIGNKYGMQSVVSVPLQSTIPGEFYTVLLTVCGVLGAMVVAAGVLMLIRRHLRSRDKLQNIARPDTEASKDYQDLCRARMTTKSQSDTGHGRVTSLSRESEQSPSSRSSTSSWSEEPALHNMDISTGHMVLSYMEDHLKNKDRLEQEWTALCAYLAEPCDTTVARLPANESKNRTMEVLPYDHSRVVLNSLSNAAGGDYINASSITDHDPRNPAYIASQGPLLETVPEFWQMVWEQGAVVIVMLTRLTEGGTGMCHRYWPEEGSELYHIYEVHLVSEHIWCDDYLVRSFYLKNVRTGETRTVTQFHFLSWPESGIPASTKALLEFRRKVNKSYRGRSCPIVVHCSDGAGRTGTYCLIDMVLSRMAKGAKEIDIAATLEHLRDQRMRMVASKQQFEFVLTAVAEEVHAILKALPPQPAPAQQNEKDKQ